MFKEIFGFSCPGFETPEELERLRMHAVDQMLKEERQKGEVEADEEYENEETQT